MASWFAIKSEDAERAMKERSHSMRKAPVPWCPVCRESLPEESVASFASIVQKKKAKYCKLLLQQEQAKQQQEAEWRRKVEEEANSEDSGSSVTLVADKFSLFQYTDE